MLGLSRFCGKIQAVSSDPERPSNAWDSWIPQGLSRVQLISSAAGIMIGLQVALRAWVSLGSWFYSDDFIFLRDASTHRLTWDFLFTPHDSHLMPLGVFITWIVAHAGAFNWALAAIITIMLQAAASGACYFMLRKLFGATWLLLVPLGFYLFSTMSLDGFVWWAAALNVMPLHIAFFLAVAWEVDFLRYRRPTHAWLVAGAFAFGLLADPRGMIIASTLVILPCLFFVDGALWRRPFLALARWWRLWLPLGILGACYLAAYSRLSPSPVSTGGTVDLPGLAGTMLGKSYLTALVGGPWHWDDANPPMGSVDPPLALLIAAAVVVTALVVTRLTRSGRTTIASFVLLAVPLAVTLLGAAYGRATQLGTYAGLLMRFLADSLPVTTLAIALTFIPVVGATLQPRRPRRSAATSPSKLLIAGCVVFMFGSLISTVRYAMLWHADYPARAFVANYRTAIERNPAVVADVPVPDLVQSPLSFPENLPSHLLRPLGKEVRTSDAGNDLRILDEDGFHRQMAIRKLSESSGGPVADCGYRVTDKQVDIPMASLDNAVFWWASVSYLASAEGRIDVRTDDRKVASMRVLPGIHTYFFQGEKGVTRLEFTNTTPGVAVCVDHIVIGDPVPLP